MTDKGKNKLIIVLVFLLLALIVGTLLWTHQLALHNGRRLEKLERVNTCGWTCYEEDVCGCTNASSMPEDWGRRPD